MFNSLGCTSINRHEDFQCKLVTVGRPDRHQTGFIKILKKHLLGNTRTHIRVQCPIILVQRLED